MKVAKYYLLVEVGETGSTEVTAHRYIFFATRSFHKRFKYSLGYIVGFNQLIKILKSNKLKPIFKKN